MKVLLEIEVPDGKYCSEYGCTNICQYIKSEPGYFDTWITSCKLNFKIKEIKLGILKPKECLNLPTWDRD